MSELCIAANDLQTNDTIKIEVAKFQNSFHHKSLPENLTKYLSLVNSLPF